MKKLIGIVGKARSGKDTLANYMVKEWGFTSRAFAEPIREATKSILMLDERFLEHNKEAKLGWVDTSYRDFAQKLGTEFARNLIDEMFWVKRMSQYIKQCDPELLVISDVRFENEATWIREQGGIILHVVRPDTPAVKEHVSEGGVTRLEDEQVIVNDGTLNQLYYKLEVLLIIEKMPAELS